MSIRKCKISNMFTLMELLVVIAIFGILVSILMPSLRRARERTRVAACLSNQAQLHRVSSLHVKDFNGQFFKRDAYTGTGIDASRYPGAIINDRNTWIDPPLYELDWGNQYEPYLDGFTIEQGHPLFSCPSQKYNSYRTANPGWAITDYSFWANLPTTETTWRLPNTMVNDISIPRSIYTAEGDWALYSDATWKYNGGWYGYNHGIGTGNVYFTDTLASAPTGASPSGLAQVNVDGSGKWSYQIIRATVTGWKAEIFQAAE